MKDTIYRLIIFTKYLLFSISTKNLNKILHIVCEGYNLQVNDFQKVYFVLHFNKEFEQSFTYQHCCVENVFIKWWTKETLWKWLTCKIYWIEKKPESWILKKFQSQTKEETSLKFSFFSTFQRIKFNSINRPIRKQYIFWNLDWFLCTDTTTESFYYVNYGSSIITSKVS